MEDLKLNTEFLGVFGNFAALYRSAHLENKQVIFWYDNPEGDPSPVWGNIIGLTAVNQGADYIIHLQVSEEGDMVLVPLSKALGSRGLEFRADKAEKESK